MRFRLLMLVTLIAVGIPTSGTPLSAYTPDDAVVTGMVADGVRFLEQSSASVQDPGELVTIAYAHFKVRHDRGHSLVEKGIQSAQRIVDQCVSGARSHKLNYEAAVSTLLLAAVDAQKFYGDLQNLKRYFDAVQMPHGGFTYPGEKQGDVSQTQYALLAIWTLDRNGIALDEQRVQAAARWLMRIQDRDGPWPYHGDDPGPDKPLIDQQKITLSMALAGGSSLLIAGDALRLWGDTRQGKPTGRSDLPLAVKLLQDDSGESRPAKVSLRGDSVGRSVRLMEQWRADHNYQRSPIDWYYYQLYTIERYESFLEITGGLPKDPSPDWYDRGVEELRRYQTPDGGWEDASKSQPHISTAFAILFLIRSTQQANQPAISAVAHGGKGFPKNLSGSRVIDGQVVSQRPMLQMETFLTQLEEHARLENIDENAWTTEDPTSLLRFSADPQEREIQLERLERLVRASHSWNIQCASARLLALNDEMRSIPSLIIALDSPHPSVRRCVRDALRSISRKFEGFGMPDNPTDLQVRTAQRSWQDWYRKIWPADTSLDLAAG